MTTILVLAETRRGELREVTLEFVGAAVSVKERADARVLVAVVDARPERFANQVSMQGVDEVLLVATPNADFEPHVTVRALEALIAAEDPQLVLTGHTVDGLGVGPALAARARLGFASDVTTIAWDHGPVAWRGAYGGKLRNELEFPGHRCTLLMLRPGSFEPVATGADVSVRAVEVELGDAARSEHVSFRDAEAPGDVDIATAPFLLSVGRAIQDRDELARFEALAERLGATLSVSRPLVDAGWAPSARQVGQSGATVKPRVYLALGISGAVQHVAGIRSANTIIAINTDSEAPIFGVAHFGATADMFELADELERELG
jgi:electron transfer flavoprotein alpha subunit